MAKYYSGISSGDTLDGMIANGGDYGINPSQDIDCENIECGIITASALKVGTGATIESNGNATLGILTTSSLICNTTTIPFYPPVVTTTQRDAMTVTAGAIIYNSSTNKLNYYDGSAWKVVSVD